jgi:DNA replication protein DnaC
MREIASELRSLRLHGMAGRFEELLAQGEPGIQAAQWLIATLLEAEVTDRHVRSIRYQMGVARFPVHRDLAGFDFAHSKVDKAIVEQLARCEFTDSATNVVFIGGTGTGKTHLATALGVKAVTQHGKRVRFFSTVELVNTLEQEKAAGKHVAGTRKVIQVGN